MGEREANATPSHNVQPMTDRYQTFRAFYPFYLTQHRNAVCRMLHFIGSIVVLLLIFSAVTTRRWGLLLLVPLVGYGFAWVGHFYFEKNRPATFTYPLYSLAGDWVMFWQLLTRQIHFNERHT